MKRIIFLSFLIFMASVSTVYASNTIDTPFVKQMPELPRGCEVTSLAMMLQQAGVDVDKMELAKKVKKVPFSTNGLRGNPHDGFVGNMYTFNKPGLGVYHRPIAELANEYLPNRILDLTGSNVETIYEMIDSGSPVWVISNSWFSHLPKNQFKTWNTSSGKIDITYRLHSVVVTGYDENTVYINDPLHSSKNRPVNRSNFEKGWVQMGSQAISYIPSELKHFYDTQDSWAKNEIEYARNKGYISGYNDYYFGPNNSLTRFQISAILDRFLLVEEKLPERDIEFNDIDNLREKESITTIARAGYIDGFKDGSFRPNDEITRAEIAQALAKLIDEKVNIDLPYEDIDLNHWAYNAIATLFKYKIMIGSNNHFKPNEPLTRAQATVVLKRFDEFYRQEVKIEELN